jgi:N-acetylmuramoyl-L-alanine amidase
MKRNGFAGAQFAAVKVLVVAGIALGLIVCLAFSVRADKKSDAEYEFERAVKMRTTLEARIESDRSLSDYKQTVLAYHKVYLITPQADDATPALIAESEMYQAMGRLFDPKYFQSAIDACNFLLKQYPGSRYRGEALLSIAQIQKDDLIKPDDAEATYKDYLKRFPRSEKSDEARAALKEIAAQRGPATNQSAQNTAKPSDEKAQHAQAVAAPKEAAGARTPDQTQAAQTVAQPPNEKGQRVEPRLADKGTPSVTSIRTWNAQDSTRVIVALDDTIKFDAARIASPDRIYFDLYKSKISPKLSGSSVDVQGGLLKSVRIAPNKPGVVRLVLDVDGAKDYSAFLLAKPYRLVIDVRAQGATTVKNSPNLAAAPTVAANVPDKNPGKSAAPPVESVSVNTPNAAPTAAPSTKNGADKASTKVSAKNIAPAPTPKKTVASAVVLDPSTEPKVTRDGQRSLTRALGLKISRIVIDAGHGGHDTGTIGPHGLMEKDLCLDVALRLGSLIEQKLPGAEVIYTRRDDTFIPLEERTAIANEAKADLFISIHANSSHNPEARGIETYYLNFATSEDSMEVATRENANSQESLHDLQDLIQKIARNEKIEESKELASDIQDMLSEKMQLVSHGEKNRGVKKAPFVVLIGANMPSVLSEISFVSNPNDERLLRKTDQRQRIADGLYRGISTYLENLNSLSYNKQKFVSDNHISDIRLEPGTVASAGNPK